MAWAATADPKKPAEAVKFFQSKRPVGSAELGKLSAKARQKAFTVASVAHADVLQSVFDEIERAITDGTSFDDFAAQVGDKLESEWGKPDSGRLETIFRTNVQSAYSAGRHARLTDPDVAQAYEYWMYDAVLDSRTSEICRSLDGTIVRADSDWWEGRHAPCHFGCRSVITPLTREDAEARGITKTPPTTLAADGFGARPAIDHAVEAERWKPEVVNYDPAIQDALDKLLPTGTMLTALADWNEDKHPRAKGGKFAPKSGGDYKSEGDKHRAKIVKRHGDVAVGTHIGELKGDKAGEHGAAALKHLHSMGLGPLLKKTKLKELHITSDIPPAKGATGKPRVGSSGRYSAQSGRLMVKVPRDPKSYGQDFVAGSTHSISKAAKTEQEAVQRTLSHEIGHHYYHATPGVDKLAARAQKKGNPITKYAGSGSPGEYFAECFAAYHHEPEALLKHDPVGWNMVQRALHKQGLVEKPAITRRKPAPMPEPPAKPEPKPAKGKKPKPTTEPAPTKQKAPPKEPEHVTIARGKERVASAERAELHEVVQRIGPPGGPPKVNTDPSKVERDGTGTCLRGDPQVMAAYSFTSQHDTIIRQIDRGMSDQEIVKSLADHLQKYRETWPQYVERLTADHPGQYDPAQGGKALEKPTDFIDACRAHHKALTELLASGGPTDGPVHRGMKDMSEDEFHKFLGQETIGLGAMSSTSRSIGMADTYSQSKGDGYGIILTMHGVKRGVGVDDTTAYEGEREVIVGKKERFKVKRVTLLGDRRAHVEVEAT